MNEAVKRLHEVVKAKEPRRRGQLLAEWLSWYTDELSATHDGSLNRAQKSLAAKDHNDLKQIEESTRKIQHADLTTQLAHALVEGGEEHGSVSMQDLPSGGVRASVMIIRSRRKRPEELFRNLAKKP